MLFSTTPRRCPAKRTGGAVRRGAALWQWGSAGSWRWATRDGATAGVDCGTSHATRRSVMASPNLVQQLEGLLPAVCGWREQIEHDRRLPAGLVTALRDTAVFALEVPAAIGGREADPVEILRAIETISRADGSTGWCVGVGVANNGAAGLMQEAGAREVFSDPSAPVAGVFAPSGAAGRVDGGVRVSGRWQFASGVTHCDWVWAGCMVMEDGRPHLTSAGPEIIYA